MKQWKRQISILLTVLLIMNGIFIMQPVKVVSAGTKPSIESTKLSIPIGEDIYSINVNNPIKKATYTYESGNKKIAKVDKKGFLTGVKVGKTKVTVYQTYKKKKTKVGTCTVTVKNSSIDTYMNDIKLWVPIGREYFKEYPVDYSVYSPVLYENKQASYSYYSSNSSILKITKAGKVMETYKQGKVKITIKETYNKKTRTVGSFSVTVKKPELTNNGTTQEFTLNQYYNILDYLDYAMYYYFDMGDSTKDCPITLVNDADGEWYGDVLAVKEGTVKVKVYADSKPIDRSADHSDLYVGSFTINVVTKPATSIAVVDFFGTLNNDKITLESGGIGLFASTANPEDTSDIVQVSVSDPSVVSLYSKDGKNYDTQETLGLVLFMAIKPGTVTLTFTAGSVKKEIEVTVKKATKASGTAESVEGIIPSKGKDSKITVTSSNPEVIKIDSVYSEYSELEAMEYSIEYTAKAVGDAVITVECDGVEQQYTYSVTN